MLEADPFRLSRYGLGMGDHRSTRIEKMVSLLAAKLGDDAPMLEALLREIAEDACGCVESTVLGVCDCYKTQAHAYFDFRDRLTGHLGVPDL